MSADIQWTTLRYIPEDTSLHKHHTQNLKSCKGTLDSTSIFRVRESWETGNSVGGSAEEVKVKGKVLPLFNQLSTTP
jgi:hypothetical protein